MTPAAAALRNEPDALGVYEADAMPKHHVNLDALILREDFEVRADSSSTPPSSLTSTLKVSDLESGSLTFQSLRKPDFQRETSGWEPAKIAQFVISFLSGDLIPSIILWRAPTGQIFVIDGAHRLSALIAWAHDDYGDGRRSREFFEHSLPKGQEVAAAATRVLLKQKVGTYEDLKFASANPNRASQELVQLARNLSTFAIQLQWVHGDAAKAETSFFKINQQAAPIDPTELQMIEARRKPSGIAARALIRAGTGHNYWWRLPEDAQDKIKRIARQVYDTLFEPSLETPIKTLDLPVAGRGYSSDSVRLLLDFVNLANERSRAKKKEGELADDEDGEATLLFLRNVKRIVDRISGDHPGSLGLHPAVYFYGATGRYQPTAFLATASLIKDLEKRNEFKSFTTARARFEELLLKHRYFTNQIVTKFGSGVRGQDWLFKFYRTILNGIYEEHSEVAILQALLAKEFSFLKEIQEEDRRARVRFSTETKSAAFLRTAIDNAVRCAICDARIHVKGMSVDHKKRVREGGRGDLENAQLTHPYCNTTYKQ